MKIKDASDKVNKALEDAAEKVERAKMTKWVVVACAVLGAAVIVFWFSMR